MQRGTDSASETYCLRTTAPVRAVYMWSGGRGFGKKVTEIEKVAIEIYWAAYDQYLGPDFRHPKGFTKEVAWQRCSETQRVFCRRQAERAIAVIT